MVENGIKKQRPNVIDYKKAEVQPGQLGVHENEN